MLFSIMAVVLFPEYEKSAGYYRKSDRSTNMKPLCHGYRKKRDKLSK